MKASHLVTGAMLTAALTSSAHAAAVALFDFSDGRAKGGAQQFIDTGMTLVQTTDITTVITNATLNGMAANTPTLIGAGISMAVDSKSGFFVYSNNTWTTTPYSQLMGDAWLNNVNATRTFTFSGLSTALQANTTYRIYFLASYNGSSPSTAISNLTYDGVNAGSQDSPTKDINNIGGMAFSFDINTGATVADTLTFQMGRPAGSAISYGIQGMGIVPVPEPSSSLIASLGGLLLCLRRRRN